MIDQIKLQLDYFQKALIEIEDSLRVFYWSKENNPPEYNKKYQVCLIPFDYLETSIAPKAKYLNLELIFLLPKHTGITQGRKILSIDLDLLLSYSEKSKDWLIQQISYLKNIQNPQRSQFLETLNSAYASSGNVQRRGFKRGELKKNCKEIAEALQFKRDEELTQDQINLVFEKLKERGFNPIPRSVASTLRDKLDYRKKFY